MHSVAASQANAAWRSVVNVTVDALQARFSHLATPGGHGSKYYSYLYSKAFAAAIWRQHLADDPFDAEAGAYVRRNLLEVGQSIPPRQMVSNLLGDAAVKSCAGGGFCPDSAELLAEIGA